MVELTAIKPSKVDFANADTRDVVRGMAIHIVSRKESILHSEIPSACFVPLLPTR